MKALQLFHASPTPITGVNGKEPLGPYLACTAEVDTQSYPSWFFFYAVSLEPEEIIKADALFEVPGAPDKLAGIILDVMERFRVTKGDAVDLLASKLSPEAFGRSLDISWLARMMGESAKVLGYKACEICDDDGGTVWFVDGRQVTPSLLVDGQGGGSQFSMCVGQ